MIDLLARLISKVNLFLAVELALRADGAFKPRMHISCATNLAGAFDIGLRSRNLVERLVYLVYNSYALTIQGFESYDMTVVIGP